MEKFLKEVNPKAFTNHFNSSIASSEAFAAKFRSRRMLVDGLLIDKAETQPMPVHLPLEEKSPRLVAIQLPKRFRDVQYRSESRKNTRKPPSVVIAAIALEAGPMSDSLFDELSAISRQFCSRIDRAEMAQTTLVVNNPAHPADEFTDRWPEDRHSQLIWKRDLNRLVSTLDKLETSSFDGPTLRRELTDLFGETLADRAIEEHYRGQAELAKHNQLGLTKTGGIVSARGTCNCILINPASASQRQHGWIH